MLKNTQKISRLFTAAGLGIIGAAVTCALPAQAAVDPWITKPAAEANAYYDVVYGNGLWVSVAASGTNRVMVTADPKCTPVAPATSCWTPVDVGTDVEWYSVTYGEGIFVAVGRGNTTTERLAMTSPDGVNWTRRTTPASRATVSSWWLEVEYGGGNFVALANRQASPLNYSVMTSPDGITWTERMTPAFTGCDVATGRYGFCNQWSGLAYGNNTWVAVSADETNTNTQIMRSSDDGATWTYVTGNTSRSWRDIIFVDNKFIATSKGSVSTHAAISTDNGATWTLKHTRTGGTNRLASNGTDVVSVVTNGLGIQSEYVALATLAASCASSNCWTDHSSSFFTVPNWTDITYGAGIYLMVSQSDSNRVAYTDGTYSPSRTLEVITVDPNDGASGTSYLSGSSPQALALPTPTRSGYTLSGWNTKRDGTGMSYSNGDTYNFSTSASQSTTLFAQWTAVATPTTEPTTTTTVVASNGSGTASNSSGTSSSPTTVVGARSVSSNRSTVTTMPKTGADTTWFVLTAVGLLATGCVMAASRRRQRAG